MPKAEPEGHSKDSYPLNISPLAGYAIVHFGNDWHAENRTSSHHIAEVLSRRLPVLYVSTPGFRVPSIMKRDFSRIVNKLREAPRLPERVGEKMWTMTMPQLPFSGVPGVASFNRMAGGALLRRAIRHLGFQGLISIFFVPHPGHFARTLGEDLSVYYCIDAYAHLPGADKAAVERYDRELTAKSDVVFFCSKKLLEARSSIRQDLVYSPHGVDAEMFGKAMDANVPVAEPLRGMGAPIIGYFGSISSWMDIDLVARMASERPKWQFVLVGMVSTDVAALRALPNVLLPGAVAYQTLPAWARTFDVCIAPYIQNQQVLNANPLKIREYLATGRPVVSMWLPEAEPFANVVRLVRQRDEFVSAIEAALEEGIEANQKARLAAVRDSTWEARGESVFLTLEDAMRKKMARAS
jgi:glycosyltransferase involved in cell wall biosynthesis